MRAFGRDLIRGGHYGQRSCEPHLKAEHMAAPTNAAYVKKALANSEPSTHGTEPISRRVRHSVRFRGISRHHADAAKLTPLIHSGLTEIGSPGTSVLCKAERH